MIDPIAFRNQVDSESQELSNQETVFFPSAEELSTLESTGQTYLIITDDEVVDLKSNLLLPSGLRAYNSGENTYVEYKDVSLSSIPVLTQEQMQIVHKGFGSLLIWFWLLFLFWTMIIFLFRLLSWRWAQ